MNDPQRPLRRLHLKIAEFFDRAGSVLIPVFLLFWTIALLFLDGGGVWLLAKNVLAMSYPSVAGEITSCEQVVTKRVSRQAVEYRYSVNGQEYIGNRRSFVGNNFSAREPDPKLLAERYAVGRTVDVYFNPNKPSDSALEQSLNGLPLVIGLFLVPFNAIAVAGWNLLSRRVRQIQSVPVQREGNCWFLLRTNGQPIVVMLIIAGSLSLGSAFVVVLTGCEENVLVMASIWCGLIGISVGAYWHTRSLIRQERPILVLDDAVGLVTWPESNDSPAFTVARDELLGVELVDQPINAEELGLAPDHVVCLLIRSDDEQPQKQTVLISSNATEAIAVAGWLQRWIDPSCPLEGRQQAPLPDGSSPDDSSMTR